MGGKGSQQRTDTSVNPAVQAPSSPQSQPQAWPLISLSKSRLKIEQVPGKLPSDGHGARPVTTPGVSTVLISQAV